MSDVEFNTTVDQTLQAEEPEKVPPIPVTVTDPVQTREMPSKLPGFDTVSVDDTGQQILSRDPRRKNTLIIPLNDVRMGVNQAQARTGGGIVPANTPIPLDTLGEVWATPADSATNPSVDVTVITQYWQD